MRMSNKRNLRNGEEKIAVTSSLSFIYKPVRFDYADDYWKLPQSFMSRKGKLDTSRRFIQIGARDKLYRTNNDYDSYAKHLRRMHNRIKCNFNVKVQSKDQTVSNKINDDRKAEPIIPPFVPCIRKEKPEKLKLVSKNSYSLDDFKLTHNWNVDAPEFVPKQEDYSEFDFPPLEEGEVTFDLDYATEQESNILWESCECLFNLEEVKVSFEPGEERAKVQGIDLEPRKKSLESKLQKYKEICEKNGLPESYELIPVVYGQVVNEHNNALVSLRTMLFKAEQDIPRCLGYMKTVSDIKEIVKGEKPKVMALDFLWRWILPSRIYIAFNNQMPDIVAHAQVAVVEENLIGRTNHAIQEADNTFTTLNTMLASVSGSIKSLYDMVKGLLDKILQFAGGIYEALSSIFGPTVTEWIMIGVVLACISELLFKCAKILDLNLSRSDYILGLGSAFIGMIKVATERALRQQRQLSFLSNITMGTGFIIFNYLLFWMTNAIFDHYEQNGEKPKVQGKDCPFMIPLSVFLGMGLLAQSGKGMHIDFLNSIRCFGGINSFSMRLEDAMVSLYQSVPLVLMEYWKFFCPDVHEYVVFNFIDKDFRKDYDALLKLVDNPEYVVYNAHGLYEFLKYYNKLRDFYLPKYNNSRLLNFNTDIDKIDDLYKRVEVEGLLPGKRIEPYVVWLSGASGVGKSTLALSLVHKLIDKKMDFNQQVYTWNPLLEFHDGYNNQPIVIINDYMQTTTNDEEQQLIAMKDTCDYPVNVSSIDKPDMGIKGEVRFTSKLIIITSNMTHMHTTSSIIEPKAFDRRRNLVINMEFKSGLAFDKKRTDYSWCQFEELEPVISGNLNQVTRRPIKDLTTVIDMIKRGYESHIKESKERMFRMINNRLIRTRSEEDEFEDALESLDGTLRSKLVNPNKRTPFEKALDFVYEHKVLTASFLGVAFATWFTWWKWENYHVMAFNSGDENTTKGLNPRVVLKLKPKIQSSTDYFSDPILNKIANNMLRLTCSINVKGQSVLRSVCGIYLGDHQVLIPKHVFYRGKFKIQEGDPMMFHVKEFDAPTTFDPDRLFEAEQDYAIYKTHFILPQLKDIRRMFVSKDIMIDETTDCLAVNLSLDGNQFFLHSFKGTFINGQRYYDDCGGVEHEYVGSDMLRFSSPLRGGDCGTPILIRQGGNFKIIGIHVGGTNTVQFAQMINMGFLGKPIEDRPKIMGFEELPLGYKNVGEMAPRYEVANHLFPFCPGSTKIKKSIAYEVLQKSTTEPCVLSPNDPRNPEKLSMIEVGQKQLSKRMEPINYKDYLEILLYMHKVHKRWKGDNFNLLSVQEAINGIEGLECLDMSTSPGYPYTIQNIKKTDMFEFDTVWKPTSFFCQEYENFIEDSKKYGMRIFWTNCVKDERRPKEKILKSRIFTISNILFTVLGRQIFGRYVSNYVKHRIEHGGCIGINPYGPEWGDIFNRLNQHQDCNDGDYSKFDKDLLKEIYDLFYRFVTKYIPNKELYGRSVHWWIRELLQTACCSERLTIYEGKKMVIASQHGNPSGWFLTVFFNDFANKVYMFQAWRKLTNLSGMFGIQEYLDNVAIFFYGDDNIFSVSKKYSKIFNALMISRILDMEYSIVYTSGDKSDVVSYNKSIWECKFLKNSFVRDYRGLIVAGLDKNTIQEMVSWTKDNDKSLSMIIDTCLRFSYFWGSEYFEQNYGKLHKFHSNAVTYEELDHEFYEEKKLHFNLYDRMITQRINQDVQDINIVENDEDCARIEQERIAIQSADLRIEEPVGASISNFGVSMVNQNINEEVKLYNEPSKVEIPEVASTLKKLLSRPVVIHNAEIRKGTSIPEKATIYLPHSWTTASLSIKDVANAYFLFKGKMKIQVTLQSTPYNSGKMIASVYYKTSHFFRTDNAGEYLRHSWMRPHVELDYSDNACNKILDIPWRCKRDYIEFNSIADLELCTLHFMNYITNAEAARLIIYAWVEDADVVVTKVNVNRPTVQGFTMFGDNVTNIETTYQLRDVSGSIIPSNLTGDQFDMKNTANTSVSGLGLDAPNLPVNPNKSQITRESAFCNAAQVYNMQKLNAFPNEQTISRFDDFGGVQDEMEVSYVVSKWSPVNFFGKFGTTKFQLTNRPGDVLAAFPVGPFGTLFGNRDAIKKVCLLDYISRNHTLWRGGRGKSGAIDIRLVVGTNRFQSGRLALIYSPSSDWQEFTGDYAPTVSTFPLDQIGGCYTAYFDINGSSNEMIVRLPYIADTPWKTIYRGHDPNQMGLEHLKSVYKNCFCGVFAIVVITPLVSPVGSPTSVDFMTFIRGAPGYEIAGFTPRNNGVPAGLYSKDALDLSEIYNKYTETPRATYDIAPGFDQLYINQAETKGSYRGDSKTGKIIKPSNEYDDHVIRHIEIGVVIPDATVTTTTAATIASSSSTSASVSSTTAKSTTTTNTTNTTTTQSTTKQTSAVSTTVAPKSNKIINDLLKRQEDSNKVGSLKEVVKVDPLQEVKADIDDTMADFRDYLDSLGMKDDVKKVQDIRWAFGDHSNALDALMQFDRLLTDIRSKALIDKKFSIQQEVDKYREELVHYRPKVQSADFELDLDNDEMVKVDCWEFIRQVFRLPKIEMELPLYRKARKARVQSSDIVLLGDEHEKPHAENDIIPTRNLRDLCKIFAPYYFGVATPRLFLNTNYGRNDAYSIAGYKIGRVITIEGLPIDQMRPAVNNEPGVIYKYTQPWWMQYGGMYMGYKGGMRFKCKIDLVHAISRKTAEASRPIPPNSSFRVMVVLDEGGYGYGGSSLMSSTAPDIGYATQTSVAECMFNAIGDSSRIWGRDSYYIGPLLADTSFADTINLEFEIPCRSFNKFHEVFGNSDVDSKSECRPRLHFFVYYPNGLLGADSLALQNAAANPNDAIRQLNAPMIRMEVHAAISDEGRFGILEEFPLEICKGIDAMYQIKHGITVNNGSAIGLPLIA